MSNELVQILDGNVFVVSDERGDIEASLSDPTGLFAFDTRYLSRWVLTIDRQRLNALSTDDLQYYEARFFLVPGTGTVYVDAEMSVIRRRSVSEGFHETLTILNHRSEPVTLEVRVEVGSDFADLFEVKDALKKKGHYSHVIEDDCLVLRYERETFARETWIGADKPAVIDPKGLTFEVTIGPEKRWSTELRVVTNHPGMSMHPKEAFRRRPRTTRCRRDGPQSRCLVGERARPPQRLGLPPGHLPSQPGRPRGAAFRGTGHPRPRAPGCRSSLVHDLVRPRFASSPAFRRCPSLRTSRRPRSGLSAPGRARSSTTSETRTRVGSFTRCATAS